MRRGRGGILEGIKRGGVILLKDLDLLASIYVARFIVWRTLRRRYKERDARRRKFKLIQGGHNSEDLSKAHY